MIELATDFSCFLEKSNSKKMLELSACFQVTGRYQWIASSIQRKHSLSLLRLAAATKFANLLVLLFQERRQKKLQNLNHKIEMFTAPALK